MKGIVTKTIGGFFFVADNKKTIYKTQIRGKIQEKVYPGDRVDFSPEDLIIESIQPRDNLLYRPRVANVDQVLIIQAWTDPPLDKRLLDRFLIMVEHASIKPLIIINKIDLIHDRNLKEYFTDYFEAGYQLLFVSAREKPTLSSLKKLLSGKINVTAGPSGVGKSSLINSLITEAELPVNSVSKKLKRGVHTTRHVELLAVKEKGWIADTPGFTSLNIDHILPENLTYYFPEFLPYINKCKFSRCSHTHEPGCNIKKEVNNGNISDKRYKSYLTFYKELKE